MKKLIFKGTPSEIDNQINELKNKCIQKGLLPTIINALEVQNGQA